MLILVINSGSSSLKYQLAKTSTSQYTPLAVGIVERINSESGTHSYTIGDKKQIETLPIKDHTQALQLVNTALANILKEEKIDAVGHRIVHGGEYFTAPTRITSEVLDKIQQLNPLAPLHNPAHVLGIKAINILWPEIPQVGVFDTAFHNTMPEKAWRYAIPEKLYTEYKIRRYGFHGTSHEYVATKTAEALKIAPNNLDSVIAHLGNGASITAIKNGKSIDTSMGFTPLEGLVMGTRSGDIDPGIISFLSRSGYGNDTIDNILNRESGLKGLCGESDLRAVAQLSEHKYNAQIALDIFTYRIAKYIGSYHIAVGGMKALTFTAGIGENSKLIREKVVQQLHPLGIVLDDTKNSEISKKSRIISSTDSSIPVLVIPTDEEQAIALATYRNINE